MVCVAAIRLQYRVWALHFVHHKAASAWCCTVIDTPVVVTEVQGVESDVVGGAQSHVALADTPTVGA